VSLPSPLEIADREADRGLAHRFLGKRAVTGQFARYAIVGGVAFLVDWQILLALVHIGLHYLWAAAVGFLAGVSANYALSTRFVFEQHRFADRRVEFALFAAIGAGGLGVSEALLFGFVSVAGVSVSLAKIATAMIVLVYNFSLRRALLFTSFRQGAEHE